MKLLVIAVGNKMPRWVNEAFEDYAKRVPRGLSIELIEVRPEPRTSGKSTAQMLEAEAGRLSRAVPRGAARVALDERGREFTGRAAQGWTHSARAGATCLSHGGADACSCGEKWRPSSRLSADAAARPRAVLLASSSTAISIPHNHPYHRE